MVNYTGLDTVEGIIGAVEMEVNRARRKHAPMHSGHEGYAVILEELDEAWAAVKANDSEAARQEMVQVAAMAVRFILDVR